MSEPWKADWLRRIPAIHLIISCPQLLEANRRYGRDRLVGVVQRHCRFLRTQVLSATHEEEMCLADFAIETICQQVVQMLAEDIQPRLRPVINATGILLHTNLGRAPLAQEAVSAVEQVASGYSNLELNLETGKRGKRYDHLRELLCQVTGAKAGLVVNNNAAAVLLVLSALAQGRQVIVSRGELVEIGGGFRIPDVLKQSGAQLVEVGTTNKTRISDYAKAITPETAILLKVHPSNYRIIGFTESVAREDLVRLGREKGIPVVEDLGSGLLLEQDASGYFFGEPTVQQVVRTGVDVVTCSGDKLLGGPQGGLIVGRLDLIDQIARHPLTRALRVDKLTIAALEATLQLYLDPEKVREKIPILRFINRKPEMIHQQAQTFVDELQRSQSELTVRLHPSTSQIGGGALPEVELPSWSVVLTPKEGSAQSLAESLRQGRIPVMGRIQEEALCLDMRTLSTEDVAELGKLIIEAISKFKSSEKGGSP
ncbi:L-seryl-tRNA(Sec) selenium transferase [Heliobacterium chlorum]|uniref:L-seryl-tRNA(Sec) selenium transferase n=1 Tax=Heliobacterium chlorum TaxID=2698 RepID=A0ABR7T5B8_HELCL|nr:L-seryl-tRNA(Sec) selenium transferase [Heliobacterium chlorum]MBC9785565.1 L-seryl-tRNA(Sec) selenium transferase [Heliobacterium chlorum]